MIQLKSFLKVIDNSGALVVECINVMGNKKIASIGDEIVVAVKKARPAVVGQQQKLKKGDVARALVTRTHKEVMRRDGSFIQFDDNACVMINKQGQPLGTRIVGPVGEEVRQKRWAKIVAMATRIV
ncbi:ribosomal protein L14b/L23e [Gorgonomyces haynaldii]|nr:ribosomal protein L14b/L23e [Gorgonomyces haynaldii]